jgi:hypothetical protein
MFRVIVLGGLNLVACGGAVTSIPDASTDGGPDGLAVDPPVPCDYCPDAFPSELPAFPPDASSLSPDGDLADGFGVVDAPTGVIIFPASDGEAVDVVDAGHPFPPMEAP